MKDRVLILKLAALITAVILIGSCGLAVGSVSLYITDSPVEDEDIESVFITVNSIEYHIEEPDEWIEVTDFEGPVTYDLLSLTNGVSEMMGEFTFPSGRITQLRFHLDAPATGDSPPSNPGCYVKLAGDSAEYPLFVPSGSTSGFKATGAFDVPLYSSVTVTADFDVRKSVKNTGDTENPLYKLSPTIRLVVDNEAGKIEGDVTYGGSSSLVVFSYKDGEYSSDELSSDPLFSSAVSSASVSPGADGSDFILAYLSAGIYDLVFAEFDSDGNFIVSSVKIKEDVTVTEGETSEVGFGY